MYKRNYFILVVLICVTGFSLHAQTDSVKVDVGARGLFVYVSNQALSTVTPLKSGAVKARILRKRVNEKKFNEVGIAQLASSAKTFNKILNQGSGKSGAGSENIVHVIQQDPILKDYTFALLNPYFLVATGAAYYDTKVKKSPTYQYKVEYLDKNDTIVRTAISNLASMTDVPNISKPHIIKVFHTDTSALLKWKAEQIPNEEAFYADVFYKINGAGKYQELPTPTVKSATDSGYVYTVTMSALQKGSLYTVYIRPKNLLDVYGTASDTASFFAVNYSTLQLMGTASAADTTLGIFLRWEKLKSKPYYLGIEIQRSTNVAAGYSVLDTVSIHDSTYYDKQVQPNKTYYYKFRPLLVENVDLGAQSTCAGVFTGSNENLIPPSGLILTRKDDVIRLTWNDADTTTFGYNVYRSTNLRDRGFRIASTLTKPEYVDSLSNLIPGKDYVYYVTSITQNNLESGRSNKVTAKIADTTKPPKINELTGFAEEYRLNLSWEDLIAKEGDIAGYNIYRKSAGQQDFKRMNEAPVKKNYLRDRDVKPGVKYMYYVTAVNYAGIESEPSIKKTLKIELPDLQPPGRIFTRSTPDGIQLSWSKVLDKRVSAYEVYRYSDNRNPHKIGTVNANKTSFLDPNVEEDVLYNYTVKSKSKQAESSDSSIKSERYEK